MAQNHVGFDFNIEPTLVATKKSAIKEGERYGESVEYRFMAKMYWQVPFSGKNHPTRSDFPVTNTDQC